MKSKQQRYCLDRFFRVQPVRDTEDLTTFQLKRCGNWFTSIAEADQASRAIHVALMEAQEKGSARTMALGQV